MSGKDDLVACRGFKRNYRSHPVKNRRSKVHCPYTNQIHTEPKDKPVYVHDAVDAILDSIPEGARVEIIVRVLGEQSPLADDPWVLLKPHTYGPNSKAKKKRSRG